MSDMANWNAFVKEMLERQQDRTEKDGEQSKKLETVKEDRWLRHKLPIDKKEVEI
ncbi:MAG: hypothetical protein ACLU85_04525 [Lachnospirales bacterium]